MGRTIGVRTKYKKDPLSGSLSTLIDGPVFRLKRWDRSVSPFLIK